MNVTPSFRLRRSKDENYRYTRIKQTTKHLKTAYEYDETLNNMFVKYANDFSILISSTLKMQFRHVFTLIQLV